MFQFIGVQMSPSQCPPHLGTIGIPSKACLLKLATLLYQPSWTYLFPPPVVLWKYLREYFLITKQHYKSGSPYFNVCIAFLQLNTILANTIQTVDLSPSILMHC